MEKMYRNQPKYQKQKREQRGGVSCSLMTLSLNRLVNMTHLDIIFAEK